MKILLVCAGGASTSILMKKMKTYAEEKGFELEIVAKGINDYDEIGSQFDMILLGPQISYKQQEIKEISQKPVAVIFSSKAEIQQVYLSKQMRVVMY